MPLLSPPSSAPLSTLPATIAGTRTGREPDPPVRAVERVPGVRDPLQDRARQDRARETQPDRPQNRTQGRTQDRTLGPRKAADRPLVPLQEREAQARRPGPPAAGSGPATGAARATASAPFLVQVFGQDLGRPRVFIAEHRDAAVRGSDAYRRAGATPPVYSEAPTLFRVAV